MIDNRIINAYAYEVSHGCFSLLEGYICEKLNKPEGYLKEQYDSITKKINAENKGMTNETFTSLIYLEYINLITKLEIENGRTQKIG